MLLIILNISDVAIQTLDKIVNDFTAIVPKIFGGLILLVLGYIFAKFVQYLSKKIISILPLEKIHHQIGEVEIFKKAGFKINLPQLISVFAFYSIMFLVSISAFEIMGLKILSQELARFIAFIPRLFTAIVILFLGAIVSEFVKKIVKVSCESFNIPSAKFIASGVFYFLFITFLITALEQAGLNTEIIKSNIIIVIAGIVLAFAVSYGFASRFLMANILTSFYSKNKLQIGDEIKIGEKRGTIIEIDNSDLVLQTENSKIIIPLHQISNEKIEIFNSK